MRSRMTYNFHELVINVKDIELAEIKDNITHVGDLIKYHRKLLGIPRNELLEMLEITSSSLKYFEKGLIYPGRDVSEKLAKAFNLSTKYFYDEYLEETDNINIKLKEYREKHKLKINAAAKLISTHETNWSAWEKETNIPSRTSYDKLKKLKII